MAENTEVVFVTGLRSSSALAAHSGATDMCTRVDTYMHTHTHTYATAVAETFNVTSNHKFAQIILVFETMD